MALILFQFPGIAHVRCCFSGRELDLASSAPDAGEARERLLSQLPGLESLAEVRQVHGTDILQAPLPASPPPADGLMTSQAGLGLLIKTADCQPVLLAAKNGRAVMAIHVGWRGNRQHFPQKAVACFCEAFGLAPADLAAVRGPSLGHAEFVNFAAEWGPEFAPWHDEATGTMNLWQLTAFQLREAGIPANQIYGVDICTLANAASYFSYRARRDMGRQGGVIWITPLQDGGRELF